MTPLAERNRAIEQLVLDERGRILRYLSALRVPASNREDLLQAGLVLLLQKWDSVNDPFPWLLGALRNLHRMELRDQSRRNRMIVPLAPPALPSMPSISAMATRFDLRIDLTRWLLELSHRQRVLILGLVLFGDPPDEVARRAGVQPSSIQSLKSRSLKRLRLLAGRNCAVLPKLRPGAPVSPLRGDLLSSAAKQLGSRA